MRVIMKRRFVGIGVVIGGFSLLAMAADDKSAEKISLELRAQVEKARGSGEYVVKPKTVQWDPKKTAVIICDMWDDHTCKGAANRVAEMAPAMNRAVVAAREKGMLIIHAPSDRTSFYADTSQRKTAKDAPMSKAPVKIQWNYWDEEKEGKPLEFIKSGGCGCEDPCPGWEKGKNGIREWKGGRNYPWTRQIKAIEIKGPDVISENGQEIYNVMEDRGIENVIVMGVHTNLCVSGRPFGLRQMKYFGKNVVLVRDLTDSLFQPDKKGFNHFRGTDAIVDRIEKTICPTIASSALTGGEEFRFKEDKK